MVDKIKLVKIEKKKEESNLINYNSLHAYKKQWNKAIPFRHIVLKNFLQTEVAEKAALEFPKFNSSDWQIYNNALEVKKLLNHWNKFGPMTYKLFYYLNSRAFIKKIEPLVGCRLFADFGINGGGLHTHRSGGKLNVHLDYSIHPKLNLERRLNLLIYITKNWKKKWGGHLGLWFYLIPRRTLGTVYQRKSFVQKMLREIVSPFIIFANQEIRPLIEEKLYLLLTKTR